MRTIYYSCCVIVFVINHKVCGSYRSIIMNPVTIKNLFRTPVLFIWLVINQVLFTTINIELSNINALRISKQQSEITKQLLLNTCKYVTMSFVQTKVHLEESESKAIRQSTVTTLRSIYLFTMELKEVSCQMSCFR